MLTIGYKKGYGHHTLFIKHSDSWEVIALLMYVDDMLIGNDEKERLILKQCLAKQFEIKKLRQKYFFEIKVAHSTTVIHLISKAH